MLETWNLLLVFFFFAKNKQFLVKIVYAFSQSNSVTVVLKIF